MPRKTKAEILAATKEGFFNIDAESRDWFEPKISKQNEQAETTKQKETEQRSFDFTSASIKKTA